MKEELKIIGLLVIMLLPFPFTNISEQLPLWVKIVLSFPAAFAMMLLGGLYKELIDQWPFYSPEENIVNLGLSVIATAFLGFIYIAAMRCFFPLPWLVYIVISLAFMGVVFIPWQALKKKIKPAKTSVKPES